MIRLVSKIGIILSTLVFTALIIFAFTHKGNLTKKSEVAQLSKTDTTFSNPKIDVKVNKQYDENGNIIRYDSSYTYIYTYPDGRSENLNIDSIYNQFKPYFFDRGFDMMQRPFNDFFELDSNMHNQFFDDDFFMKQFEQEMFRFDDLMNEMDSLRNLYLKEMYPGIEIEKKPINIKSNDPIEI